MCTTASASPIPVAEPCQGFITHLVLRCGRGDEAALGDLFDLTFFLVAAAVPRGTGTHTSSAFDDEVVEAFRRIWRRSVAYQPKEQAVLAWVLDQARDAQESASGRAKRCRTVTA